MPRHPRDAFAREMSRVRGTPQESAEHDGLRRHRDPRLSVRTLQVLDGPKASRAHAVRIHPEVLMRVRYEGGFLVQDLLKEVILRSEEHTSELQSHSDLVCRLLL